MWDVITAPPDTSGHEYGPIDLVAVSRFADQGLELELVAGLGLAMV